jgi:hypothetical protein
MNTRKGTKINTTIQSMKNTFATVFIVLLAYAGSAQKVNKFCEISTSSKSFNKGVNVSIDVGNDTSLFSFKDKTIKEKLFLVTRYSNVIDALNYMSELGWTLVNTVSNETSGSTFRTTFYFKKVFDQLEIGGDDTKSSSLN